MEKNEKQKKSVFETLNEINVSGHIEKKEIGKGRTLSYVSWCWAWAEVKKRYPDASYKVYEAANGMNYFDDGRTAYVKCSVTIEGEEIIEYLPVMNGAQKSMPLDQVTSHDIIRSIQRCVTKAIARHGLGLYVYAGEDLPETEAEEKKREQEEAEAKRKAEVEGQLPQALASVAKCSNVGEMKDVYDAYPALKSNARFKAAINDRAKELQQQPKDGKK